MTATGATIALMVVPCPNESRRFVHVYKWVYKGRKGPETCDTLPAPEEAL